MNRKEYFEVKDFNYYNYIYDDSLISSPLLSSYLPFYAYNNTENLYKLPASSNIITNYKNILKTIKGKLHNGILFSTKNNTYTIRAYLGCLIEHETNNFLLLFVTGKNKLPEEDKIFLSYNFYDPKYKILYNKVFTEIILPALKKGVPMEIISSKKIKDIIFKPIHKTLSDFNTIKEHNEYLKNIGNEYFNECFNEEIPF